MTMSCRALKNFAFMLSPEVLDWAIPSPSLRALPQGAGCNYGLYLRSSDTPSTTSTHMYAFPRCDGQSQIVRFFEAMIRTYVLVEAANAQGIRKG